MRGRKAVDAQAIEKGRSPIMPQNACKMPEFAGICRKMVLTLIYSLYTVYMNHVAELYDRGGA